MTDWPTSFVGMSIKDLLQACKTKTSYHGSLSTQVVRISAFLISVSNTGVVLVGVSDPASVAFQELAQSQEDCRVEKVVSNHVFSSSPLEFPFPPFLDSM